MPAAVPEPVSGILGVPWRKRLRLSDRIFREDLFDALECLLCGDLWRHPFLHYVDPAIGKGMLVLHLGKGWVVDPEVRYRRTEQGLRDICHAVRIGGVEPPRVGFDD